MKLTIDNFKLIIENAGELSIQPSRIWSKDEDRKEGHQAKMPTL